MNTFKEFIAKHDKHFVKYNIFTDVKKSSERNWLYLFDVDYYDRKPTQKLPKNTIKFGETTINVWSRLNQYKETIGMRNIETISCRFPKEREAILKRYLRKRTNYKPICGKEYFCDCRDYIKVLILIIVSLSDEDILLSYRYYAENNIQYTKILDNISIIYDEIKSTETSVLDIKINTIADTTHSNPNIPHACNICQNVYTTLASLNHHKKYSKTCLQIQNKELEFPCEHCNKPFSSSYTLQAHLAVCKQKKANETNSIIQERDFYKLEYLKSEERIKIAEERERMLEERIKLLEEQNFKLIDISYRVNSKNNTQNTYNSRFNTMFDDLIMFDGNNVTNSIKEIITEEHTAQLDLHDIQKSILRDIVVNSINKFTFCTDSKRNTMVTRNSVGEQKKIKLDDFLEEYMYYGKVEIYNYINTIINNKLLYKNAPYTLSLLVNQLYEKISSAYEADDIKNTVLFKDILYEVKQNFTRLKKGI